MKSSAKAKALIAALGASLSQDLMAYAAQEASFRRAAGSMTKKDFETLLERMKRLGYEAHVAPVELAPELCFKVVARCKLCGNAVTVAGDLTEEQARRMALHGVGTFSKLHVDVDPEAAAGSLPCRGTLDIIGLLPR